ncbi:hypothetical protein WT11_01740 [Burkholderia stagnalis]|uniref:MATE family efflux transporter n=1 Tax=Burkholderia stagnalis TaxID=1503054 RepID=UPI00075AE6C5|nr:MATE family efflux transporter [Burkholderia stagnalis]KVN25738.1 hypothetical protein WT11_01740 [Burkholderia stagnalis]
MSTTLIRTPLLREEFFVIARLAATMATTRMLSYVSGIITMSILGHYSTVGMASLTLAMAIQQVMVAASFSGLVGTETEVAKRHGAGEHERATAFVLSSILVAFGMGCLMSALSVIVSWVFASRHAADGVDAFSPLQTIGYGMPAFCIYLSISFYFEATQRPRFVLLLAILGTSVTALATFWLVHASSALGISSESSAALALTLSRYVLAAVALAMVLWMNRRGLSAAMGQIGTCLPHDCLALLKIGVPAGFADAMTTVSVSSMTWFVGNLGVVALNAYQIASQWLGLLMLIGAGCATAATIRATQAMGALDRTRAVNAASAGIMLLLMLDAIAWIAYLAIPGLWAHIYGASPEVTRYAIPNQKWATLIFAIECPLILLIGVGRAYRLTVRLPVIKACCFILIALPACVCVVRYFSDPLPYLLSGIVPAVLVALLIVAWNMRPIFDSGHAETKLNASETR